MKQVPDLDAILVPVSGGGMTSGIAIAAKTIKPDIKGQYCCCSNYANQLGFQLADQDFFLGRGGGLRDHFVSWVFQEGGWGPWAPFPSRSSHDCYLLKYLSMSKALLEIVGPLMQPLNIQ